jgi:cytidine deaminase
MERRIIEAAEALLDRSAADRTVAASRHGRNGRIHTAVNIYVHRRTCAELVTLGVAATAEAGPLVRWQPPAMEDVVSFAVWQLSAGDIDLHPDILVAVPTVAGPQMRPIAKLLSDTYFFPDAQAERVFRFNRRYYDAVASGRKTSSVRWDERIEVGPAIFYFEDDAECPPLRGKILEIQRYRINDLTPERLRLSNGGGTVEGYLEVFDNTTRYAVKHSSTSWTFASSDPDHAEDAQNATAR